MRAHTPGPWLIASESGTFVYALNSAGSNRFWLNVAAAGPGRAEKSECEANARLIAASPEMLTALKHGYRMALHVRGPVRDYNQRALCEMRDAIAAAEGREPEEVQDEFEAKVIAGSTP